MRRDPLSRRLTQVRCFVAALLALASGVGAAGADGDPIIEYTLVHHMLRDSLASDAPPLLRVYADGTVRAHYPIFMTRAGDYALRLSPDEVSRLMSAVADTGLLSLDLAAARDQRRRAQGAALYHVSDVTETVIRIRLASDTARTSGLPAGAVDTTVRWPNVYTDRRRFPGLAAVAKIASAERLLLELLERPDLVRVAP